MTRDAWALLIVTLSLLVDPTVATKKYNITIGYLPCITGEPGNGRQGLTISGAISVALKELNNRTDILPDVKLLLNWRDTQCDTAKATQILTDMSTAGVSAFFGPEGTCRTEAIFAQSKNLPMISYRCLDQITALPNFVNMEPREEIMKSLISLLRYYRWNKIAILYEDSWEPTAQSLAKHANRNNMTVNHLRRIADPLDPVPTFWHQLIRDTTVNTRIYVLLGSPDNLLDMMTVMESLKLFSNGEYMVLFVDMLAYSPDESYKYLIRKEDHVLTDQCRNTEEFYKLARSLMVVTVSQPALSYEAFNGQVRLHNTLEPFKFPIFVGNLYPVYISIYSAYLYDSVKLYAMALDEIIKEESSEEELTYERLQTIAKNGTRIVAKMISSSPYKSISGMSINLNEHSVSGDFSVLAFKPTKDSYGNFNCPYNMIPVGHFQQTDKEYPLYKINPRQSIDWADGVKPEDVPSFAVDTKNSYELLALGIMAILV